MSHKTVAKIWWLCQRTSLHALPRPERNCLRALAPLVDKWGNGHVYPALSTLAKRSEYSVRTTRTALRNLEAKGYLHTELCAGPYGANVYTLSVPELPQRTNAQGRQLPLSNYKPQKEREEKAFIFSQEDRTRGELLLRKWGINPMVLYAELPTDGFSGVR